MDPYNGTKSHKASHISIHNNRLANTCCYILIYVMLCAIWYHLYNLKNAKNTHGGVLLLVNFSLQLC